MKLSASIVALVATSVFSGGAFAADLSARKAPPMAVELAPSWAGLYLGLNAGGVSGGGSAASVASAPIFGNTALGLAGTAGGYLAGVSALGASTGYGGAGGSNGAGFLGGAQIGYNWQMGNAVSARASTGTSRVWA